MEHILLDVNVLRRIIRNAKEAVEKEVGQIVSEIPTDKPGVTKKELNNVPYATFVEVLRGVLYNMPKEFNLKDNNSDLPY